jgi:coenzyme F420-reducing hydrogenase delta subunit
MKDISPNGNEINVISLPCSGKLDILYLLKAFETGADGAAVMICREGECRYVEGNLRARKRAGAVEALLEESGLNKGRVATIQMGERGIEEAKRELETFCLKVAAMDKDTKTKELRKI